ncbi:MAG: hypothetical protein ACYSTR_02580 [Planctomycetota bacterium]
MRKTNKRRRGSRKSSAKTDPVITVEDELAMQKRRCQQEWFILLLLLVFGSYQSILYFGHLQVPNSDFTAFVETAGSLLDCELPGSFKRVPMLGLLQTGVSQFCFGPHPVLTAGWVLNGILHTLSVLLFYRVGKHLLGRNAFFFAVLAGLNPWVLKMTTDPIAETTMIFMTLLTFDFLLRRSRWCYLFAMMASLTRYELAVLIAVAFFVDMVLYKRQRERIASAMCAFLASVPIVLWIILWQVFEPDSQHYTGHFINTKTQAGLQFWKLLWETTFCRLLQMPAWVGAVFGKLTVTSQQHAADIRNASQALEVLIRFLTGAGILFAVICGAIRKNWKFLALFAFWAIYVGIHTVKHKTLDRYTIPAIWLTFLFAFYGFRAMWVLIRGKWTIPKFIISVLQFILIVISLIWIIRLFLVLPMSVPYSERSTSLVYVSLMTVLLYLCSVFWVFRRKAQVFPLAVSLVFFGLLITSNHFQVVRLLGNGNLDAEFKMTADWYHEHTDGTGILVTSLPGVMNLYLPERGKNAIHIQAIPGTNLLEFAQSCKKKNVMYIAWDSRLGFAVNDFYYKKWGLKKIHPLGKGEGVGPFEFVKTFKALPRRHIHLYRFHSERIQ